MKRKFLGYSGISFLLLIYSACSSSDPGNLIARKWDLENFSPNPDFEVPDSITKKIEDSLLLEFTTDGRYLQSGIGETKTGTYQLSVDGKLVLYTSPLGETYTDTIVELTKEKLSVIEENGSRRVFKAAGR